MYRQSLASTCRFPQLRQGNDPWFDYVGVHQKYRRSIRARSILWPPAGSPDRCPTSSSDPRSHPCAERTKILRLISNVSERPYHTVRPARACRPLRPRSGITGQLSLRPSDRATPGSAWRSVYQSIGVALPYQGSPAPSTGFGANFHVSPTFVEKWIRAGSQADTAHDYDNDATRVRVEQPGDTGRGAPANHIRFPACRFCRTSFVVLVDE